MSKLSPPSNSRKTPQPPLSCDVSADVVLNIPANWYHDAEIFEREKDLIFDIEWLPLGPVATVSAIGDWFVAELTGASVLVSRTGEESDAIEVFHNICRHRGAPIVDQPRGNNRRFVCPYHGWAYNLDGSLSAAPGFDVAVSVNDACDSYKSGLLPVRSAIWNGVVWACLSENTPSLLDWLGEIPAIAARFSSIDSFEYEIQLSDSVDINWKTYGDNSAEGYHLEYIHPGLASSITADSDIRRYTNGQFVGFDIEYKPSKGGNGSRGFWIYKFPGVLLHFSENSFNLERVTPVSATQILLNRWFWFNENVDSATREQTIASSTQVMSEDIGICRKVQRNLRNGRIQRGVLSATREPGTVYMQELVQQRLAKA